MKMEDNLNFFLLNERPRQMFWKWKTTSNILKMEDNQKKSKMNGYLNLFDNLKQTKNNQKQ